MSDESNLSATLEAMLSVSADCAATTYTEAFELWRLICDREVRRITVANACGGMTDAQASREVALLARITAAVQIVAESGAK